MSKNKWGAKWRWPLVWRRTLECKENQLTASVTYERLRADREIAEKSKIIDSLLPKLIKVTMERPQDVFGRFRVSVDFTDEFIYSCFAHGNSQDAIYYLSQQLSHMVEREIRTINFQRVARTP